ncbi:MAG: CPBP family intramembrane glutamic endopeptidase [Anaerolineaceae bacterium]
MQSNPYPVPLNNRNLTWFAWGVTVLVSVVPDIAFNEIVGFIPAWLFYVKIGFLIGLCLIAFLLKPLQPLRNFFLILIAFFGLNALRSYFDFTLPFLQKLLGGSVFDSRMQAEQTGKLAVSIAMILVLLILGYKRKQFFLTRGDLKAPIDPVPWLGFPKRDPWPKFGLQWGLYIAIALAVFQYFGLRPGVDQMLRVIPILPSILFYAALNAFNEEIVYRSPMLVTLEPIGGSKHALWMAAFFFGIGHYFGVPGGLVGGVLSIFMGWILGKGMVETRGFFWTWWIHLLSDIAIFSFLAMSLV